MQIKLAVVVVVASKSVYLCERTRGRMAEKARGRCGARARIDRSCFSRHLVPRPRIFEFKKRQMYCFQNQAQTLPKMGFYYVCFFCLSTLCH